ncbi:MAG: hypothetical protein H6613_15675 [Ignavibacteriales bacterium]|nr:hypothetical protein [Ignavibacteriales bacterium]
MSINFVPDNFNVPTSFVNNLYRLEILAPIFAELDYDAVITSKERLRGVFAEHTEWPKDDISLEDNIRDLKRHEKEFHTRKAFAYSVLTLKIDKCLGCVYIEPSLSDEFDCDVYLWMRDSEINLDEILYKDVKNWLAESWPFKNVIFPGREITWQEWNYLRPEK